MPQLPLSVAWKSSNQRNSVWNRPMSRIISSRFVTKYKLILFKDWGLEMNDPQNLVIISGKSQCIVYGTTR